MGILLAFAPFLAFALVDRFIGPIEALLAGVVVSALLVARDWFRTHRAPKLLEIGTLVLFGGLFLHLSWRGAAWSVIAVRLCVDAGLLAIVLVSLAIRRPFTLQYARDQAPRELWTDPAFIRANYVISAVWALAFAVMVVAELALLYLPDLPPRLGIIAIVLALVAAVKFTGWYPAHLRRKASP